ncbi:hypothetical protein FNV43_RR00257 [Rhamnella rubrinervis]|uniref:Uncharacterized protein n=1 Tax=Rhamnella rubrinervis TaxID=2594499 RepID=A0A8K0HN85_9ROSA|nr:hypothetical protein FNV43_RR00257 [Rhamnella rubrinervis]
MPLKSLAYVEHAPCGSYQDTNAPDPINSKLSAVAGVVINQDRSSYQECLKIAAALRNMSKAIIPRLMHRIPSTPLKVLG